MGVLRDDVPIKRPLLSVIIPVYNGERYLGETIECILNASYKEIELLLIDDGSSDDSAKLCAAYMKTEQRIRYIYQENGGIVSARNKGLLEASGDYVCFCDQDDLVEPLMYERLINKMALYEAEIGLCSTGRFKIGRAHV